MTESPQRKLAVILHADVVGSTALVRLDETLAHERIRDTFRRLAETVAGHGGSAHEIRGDALVAEFARASDAVSAAAAFQHANTARIDALDDDVRPVVRIGIAIGEVVVADNTVTGEGVILAQRLEQLATHGGICIQGSAHETIPKRLPFDYQSLGECTLKGFDDPVRAYAVSLKAGVSLPLAELATRAEPAVEMVVDKPSIAVLPFTNMSGDPEQEYFSDGVTEDIITELSRFRSLFVISRHSSFIYKGQTTDIRRIGEQLGVRYLLEGSVRRAGKSLRITAQLIEAESGKHIWAERYDRGLEDIFAVQDEVSRTITATLVGRVEHERLELTRNNSPEALAAHEHLLRGKTYLYRYTDDDIATAMQIFQQAVAASPEHAEAHAWLSQCHSWRYAGWWSKDPADTLRTALSLAETAVVMDPALAQAHGSFAYALVYQREFRRAMHHFEKGIELMPCDAENTSNYGWCMMFNGDPDEGLRWIDKGERLNPLHEWWHAWLRGMAQYAARRYDEALESFAQVLRAPAEVEGWRAAALAGSGDAAGAGQACARFVERARTEFALFPGEQPDGWRDYWCRTQPFRDDGDMDHLLTGLRSSGLPL